MRQDRDEPGPWIDTPAAHAAGRAHIIGIQALHPAAQRAHVTLYRELMFSESPLSRAEREAIAVVVSAANDCFY